MRSRRTVSYLTIVTGLVALAVAVPGIASAKGPTDARVDGPELAEPIAMTWDEGDDLRLTALIDASGFWKLAEPAAKSGPAGDLGSRYVITFSVYSDDGTTTQVALHAYPFAQPDPWVYVPAGQNAFPMGALPEGWRPAIDALTTWFVGAGVSRVVPAAGEPTEPAAQPQRAATASSSTGWLGVALGGIGVLAVAGLVVMLVRRGETAPAL